MDYLNMKPDEKMRKAIACLVEARRAFHDAAQDGLILGNDNHIGDIGEYWVRKHLEGNFKFKEYAPKKNSRYDMEMTDGNKISVKTITAWSKKGYGTQVKPLCGNEWQILAAVSLNENLQAAKIALVPIKDLLNKEPFNSNAQTRQTRKTFTYPRFKWWDWLDDYVVFKHP